MTNIALQETKCHLLTYSSEQITPIGKISLNNAGNLSTFQVAESGTPILGKEACVTLKLLARIDSISDEHNNELTNITTNAEAQELVIKYSDLYSGLGKIKTNVLIHVDHNIPPVIDPPCRIPAAIESKVKDELSKMLKLGVIVEQNEPTKWVNSITIVKKPNKICVCLNPTKLNKAILHGPYPNKTIEEVVMKTANAKYFSMVDANSGYWQIKLDEESSKLCTFNTP